MPRFPKPIPIPKSVSSARTKRYKNVLRSAGIGIFIRLGIIIFEFTGVALYGSSSLLMDALSSLLDVAATIVLMISIRLAERPPDHDHPFGHGRYEPLTGLQLGLLLVAIGGGMLFQQTFQLTKVPVGETINKFTWIFPFVALISLEICYQIISRVAKSQKSTALAADAFHYRVDGATSLLACIALIIAAFNPEWSLIIDHFGAIVIAILMIGMGLYASKSNLNQLLDRIPDPLYFERVRNSAENVTGVLGTEKIRIQLYGPDAHVDVDIEVDPHMPVEDAHRISQKVRAEIQKEWPTVRDVTVHIEPFYPNDH